MTKTKSTKRALLGSALALLVCVSMLVGSTFAWFTDSVTSAGNKIVAGTLQVDLELLEEDGSWTSIKESGKAIFDYENWEPGYTDVKILRVSNKGTLALKWLAKFVSDYELSALADVIDVYVNTTVSDYPDNRSDLSGWTKVGTVKEFVNTISATTKGTLETGASANLGIALKMQETASNQYQGMDLGGTFDIQIIATQYTSEEDSFDNQYDLSAAIYVDSAAEAQAALDNAKKGDVIVLASGVDYGTLLLRPVDGNANTTTSLNEANGEGLTVYRNEYIRTVEDLTILGTTNAKVDAIKVESGYIANSGSSCNLVDVKGLVIDSVEFTDKADCTPHTYSAPIFFNLTWTDVDGLTVKNCKLIGNDDKVNFVYFTIDSSSAFDGVASNVTLTGNTVDGIARLCELRQTKNVTITDNVIKNTVLHGMLLTVHNGSYTGNVTITGNTAVGINERFVRMAGAGDANVVIKDNTILNYEGEDADYIKVTDSTGTPVIENNIVGRSVYGLTLIPNGTDSKIIVSDKEGFLNLTKLFADWTELFTDGNGTTYTNYANGAGADYYYSGKWTVSLEADIDLNNATISPVVIKHPVSAGNPTFDGNGKTIKNAKIVTDPATENEAGLFNASSIAFKNLKLDNIHVTGSNVGNSTAGVLAGSCSFPVDNITITNSSVTGGKYTGGVVGYGYTDVLNCTLTNVTVKGGYKLGGLIGYICASSGTGDVTGNTLTDCTVDGIGGGVYAGGKTEYVIGKLVGNYNCDGTCNNNTITNMTTSATDNIGKIEAGKTVAQ